MLFCDLKYCISAVHLENSDERGHDRFASHPPEAAPYVIKNPGKSASLQPSESPTSSPPEAHHCCAMMVRYLASGNSQRCSSNYDTIDNHAKQRSHSD